MGWGGERPTSYAVGWSLSSSLPQPVGFPDSAGHNICPYQPDADPSLRALRRRYGSASNRASPGSARRPSIHSLLGNFSPVRPLPAEAALAGGPGIGRRHPTYMGTRFALSVGARLLRRPGGPPAYLAGQFALAELDAVARAQHALSHPDALGRHLDQLVVLDEIEALLERHLAGRHQLDGGVLGGGPHARFLLLLGGVDVDVPAAPVEPDDHAFVDLRPGADEGLTALLDALQPIGDGHAGLGRRQHPVARPRRQGAPFLPANEAGRHHAGASRQCQD